MMTEKEFVVHGKIDVPYRYTAGKIGSRFLLGLRVDRKIMGIRCPTCNRVYCPPKSICTTCFNNLDEWVEVRDQGAVTSYTIVRGERKAMHPKDPPFVYGIIQLEGSDTGMLHLLGEIEPENVAIGMRVQAVYKDERKGSILDIDHFKPI
jgi:uncharacterized OB-fold protein